jgi:hypothetical protein
MRFRPYTAARQRFISGITVLAVVILAVVTLIRPLSAQTLTLLQDRTQTLSGFSYNLAWETSGVTSCTVSHTKPDGTIVSNWASGTSGNQTVMLIERGTHDWLLSCDGSFNAEVQHVVMPVMSFAPNSGFTSDPLPGIAAILSQLDQWPITEAYTQYYSVAAQWFRYNSAEDVGALLHGLAQAGLALQVEGGVLSANGCGHGVEGFNASDLITAASIISQHGGTIDRVDMDEPYYYGSLYSGPNACKWSMNRVAKQAAATIAQIRAVFPEVIVGDAEPILMPWDPHNWLTLYPAWAAAYQTASGTPLAFFMADIPSACPTCMPGPLVKGAAALHAMGIPFGAFYGPNNQNSNAAWMWNAKLLARYYENKGFRPDLVGIATWNPYPDHLIPETDGTSLASLAHWYLTTPASATLSQTVTSSAAGASFTITWNSLGTSNCTLQRQKPDGTTENAWASDPAGSKIATPAMVGTHRWWIDCFDDTGQAVAHSEIYHAVHPLGGPIAMGSPQGRGSGGQARDYAQGSTRPADE